MEERLKREAKEKPGPQAAYNIKYQRRPVH